LLVDALSKKTKSQGNKKESDEKGEWGAN